MALFGKEQSDEEWLAEIRPRYDTASAPMHQLDRALNGNSLRLNLVYLGFSELIRLTAFLRESREDRYTAVQRVLEYLPSVENSVKQIRRPSSTGAQQAHKKFKSALKNYTKGAKQGAILFKDMEGGPGQRAANETSVARGLAQRQELGEAALIEQARANIGRLSLLRSFARFGSEDMEVVSRFLAEIDERAHRRGLGFLTARPVRCRT